MLQVLGAIVCSVKVKGGGDLIKPDIEARVAVESGSQINQVAAERGAHGWEGGTLLGHTPTPAQPSGLQCLVQVKTKEGGGLFLDRIYLMNFWRSSFFANSLAFHLKWVLSGCQRSVTWSCKLGRLAQWMSQICHFLLPLPWEQGNGSQNNVTPPYLADSGHLSPLSHNSTPAAAEENRRRAVLKQEKLMRMQRQTSPSTP